MNVKITLILILIFGMNASIDAQQQPFYTQYILNPFISNPALAGIENYWDVKMSYRNQWQGIEGAPQTAYFTIQGPLQKTIYTKGTTTTVAPPRLKKSVVKNYWLQYKSIIPHAGIGFTFYNDKVGPLNRYAAQISYAYHIGLSPKTSLSAGLAGGIQGVNLNTDKLNFGTTNPNDPTVAMNGVSREIRPDLSFGLWLYSSLYFIGASAQNAIPVKTNYSDVTTDQVIVTHIVLSAGYKFFLNESITFLPSTMVRLVKDTPVNFDLNAKFQYRDAVWAGVSYRHIQSFAVMLGMNLNSTFNLGYAYDFTTSNLQYASNGTHEIVLGVLLGNRNRVLCPRDFW